MVERSAGPGGRGKGTDVPRADRPERPDWSGVIEAGPAEVVGPGTEHEEAGRATPVEARVADAATGTGTEARGAGRPTKAPAQETGDDAGRVPAQPSGPGRRPVRRKPARKNIPVPAPSPPAQPWEGEPWRIGPQGMVPAGVKERWTAAQGGFVDDPARAVREADALAAEVGDAVVAGIEARRAELRAVWDGETAEADTESLRLVLREYRSYVERLVGD